MNCGYFPICIYFPRFCHKEDWWYIQRVITLFSGLFDLPLVSRECCSANPLSNGWTLKGRCPLKNRNTPGLCDTSCLITHHMICNQCNLLSSQSTHVMLHSCHIFYKEMMKQHCHHVSVIITIVRTRPQTPLRIDRGLILMMHIIYSTSLNVRVLYSRNTEEHTGQSKCCRFFIIADIWEHAPPTPIIWNDDSVGPALLTCLVEGLRVCQNERSIQTRLWIQSAQF